MKNDSNILLEISIVMPCLNEAETIEVCIKKAKKWLQENGVAGEVVIGDNGSTDGSQQMAINLGARVIDVPQKGYGAALMGAIEASNSKFVVMADSDDSYDFSNLSPFIESLRKGNDLVMGNRFKGGIMPGAMPFLHRYLGNPVLSFIGRLFFNCPVGDFHCGLRGFRQDIVSLLEFKNR
jgi:glycosyltransferase involved in cell wall biosynthesis